MARSGWLAYSAKATGKPMPARSLRSPCGENGAIIPDDYSDYFHPGEVASEKKYAEAAAVAQKKADKVKTAAEAKQPQPAEPAAGEEET